MDGTGLAVEVNGAHRFYGSLHVLKELDMKVPYGCIYGLLGSSGCGKTTLLRCILGRLQLAEGDIKVLGKSPGTRGHTIPGKDVGYMPQELALFGDFTMLETMYYFGILHGLSFKKIRERGQFLLELLELPSVNKRIRNLSGGQQRRVSFAVAMLQEPPLLILDEPTVGVDPLLRSKIWQHLLDLVQTTQATIIITTHYIEEARQAHLVGLMRDGRLLAESPPNDLITSYRMNTLEEVFLQLCRNQDYNPPAIEQHTAVFDSENKKEPTKNRDESYVTINESTPLIGTTNIDRNKLSQKLKRIAKESCEFGPCNPSTVCPRPRNVLALCWKNSMRILRNPGILLFQFVLPAIQISLFCWAIGRNLEGINVAVVNQDQGLGGKNICEIENFGSSLISSLSNKTLNLHYLDSPSEAIDRVKHGKAWAAIIIPENFSIDLRQRAIDIAGRVPVPDDIINSSTVEIYEDVTNLQLTFTLQKVLLDALENLFDKLVDGCNLSRAAMSSPVVIHDPPVYGNLHLSYTDYVAPGMIISIMFGFSIGLTALSLVIERKEGLMDRTWVAGVNVSEIIIAQVITQFFVLLVQITLLVTVIVFGFKVYLVHKWSLVLVGSLTMLQGLTGMGYGLLISSLSRNESSAIQIMAGSFYPVLLLSGIIWPIEGMPKFLQYISNVLPTTYAAEAMRSIMERGWGLDETDVWKGYLVTIAWFLLFLMLAALGLRLRK